MVSDSADGLCLKCLFAAGLVAENSRSEHSFVGTVVRYFGDYEVLDEISRGGMGCVFRARQRSLNRLVALKLIASGPLASNELVQRFRTEAQAAANLDHPNIVPIYEIGEQEGQHYFSMQLIDGLSLDRKLAGQPMENRAAAALLVKVSRAIHHAHQRGVLHRDIKPGNILVRADDGEPLIVDFGLAKLVEGDAQLTHSLNHLGTPSYMSPEQAQGLTKQLTVATDVYGIGTVFYEALTGRAPFKGQSSLEIARHVIDSPPTSPGLLNRRCDRDLETICLKCLEKEPARRYQSAAAVADDLERWWRGEPIQARPAGWFERAGKLIRRQRTVFAAAASVATIALAASITVLWQGRGKARQEQALKYSEARAAVAAGWDQFDKADPIGALASFRRAQAIEPRLGAHDVRIRLAAARAPVVGREIESGLAADLAVISPDRKLALISGREAGGHRAKMIDLESGGLWDLAETSHLLCAEFNPDGTLLATGAWNGSARTWNATNGHPVSPPIQHKFEVRHLAFRQDGQQVATGASTLSASKPGEILVWRSHDGDVGWRFEEFGMNLQQIRFSPDGKHLAVGSLSYSSLWLALDKSREATRLVQTPPGCWNANSVVLSHNGWMAAVSGAFTGTASEKGTTLVSLRDRPTNSAFLPHNNTGRLATFSRDDRLIATVADDLQAKVWETDTGRTVGVALLHTTAISSLEFSPDGHGLLTGAADGCARIWDYRTGRIVRPVLRHEGPILLARFVSSNVVVIASADGKVKTWHLPGPEIERTIFQNPSPALTSWADPSSETFWSLTRDGALFEIKPDKPPLQVLKLTPPSQAVRWDDASRTVLLGQPASIVLRMDDKASMPKDYSIDSEWSRTAALSGDGNRVLVAGTHGILKLHHTLSGQLLLKHKLERAAIASCLDATGETFALILEDGSVVEGDRANSWRTILAAADKSQRIENDRGYLLCYSPDGRELWSTLREPHLNRHDRQTGKSVGSAFPHGAEIRDIAFFAGHLVATASTDETARVWKLSGEPITPPLRHAGAVSRVCFSRNGLYLATCSRDGSARIWDTKTGDPVTPRLQHAGFVYDAFWTPGDTALLTAGEDGSVKLWNFATSKN